MPSLSTANKAVERERKGELVPELNEQKVDWRQDSATRFLSASLGRINERETR